MIQARFSVKTYWHETSEKNTIVWCAESQNVGCGGKRSGDIVKWEKPPLKGL